jgi:Cupin-like domain
MLTLNETRNVPEARTAANDANVATHHSALLNLDAAAFRLNFNQRLFEVQHRLAGHALFALPRLIELARDTAQDRPEHLYYDAGDIDIETRWENAPKSALPIDETIQRIDSAGAWIILWNANLDREYQPLLDRCMHEIFAAAEPGLEKRLKKKEIIIFITSPNRVSSYHIDRECNFLLQILGRKQISIFDHRDRLVLTEEEIERFWTVDNNAATYKPALQDRASVITLEPGNGVHIPVNSPHWVKNSDNVSISASFNFQFHDSERANVYRTNYYFRKLGLTPRPPFQRPAIDFGKNTLYAAGRAACRLYRTVRGTS